MFYNSVGFLLHNWLFICWSETYQFNEVPLVCFEEVYDYIEIEPYTL